MCLPAPRPARPGLGISGRFSRGSPPGPWGPCSGPVTQPRWAWGCNPCRLALRSSGPSLSPGLSEVHHQDLDDLQVLAGRGPQRHTSHGHLVLFRQPGLRSALGVRRPGGSWEAVGDEWEGAGHVGSGLILHRSLSLEEDGAPLSSF